MLEIFLLFLLSFIKTVSVQNIRTLALSKITDLQYQCVGQSCASSIVIYGTTLRRCQMACANDLECRTMNFNQSNGRCEMFADIPGNNGYLVTQVGIVTMTAIDSRKSSARK